MFFFFWENDVLQLVGFVAFMYAFVTVNLVTEGQASPVSAHIGVSHEQNVYCNCKSIFHINKR